MESGEREEGFAFHYRRRRSAGFFFVWRGFSTKHYHQNTDLPVTQSKHTVHIQDLSFDRFHVVMAVANGSRPSTPDNSTSNGLYSGVQTPRTPMSSSLALTEYTANPTPPNEPTKDKAQSAVPDAFLLPNGFPDVRSSRVCFPSDLLQHAYQVSRIVSSTHTHLEGVRCGHRDAPHICNQPQHPPGL